MKKLTFVTLTLLSSDVTSCTDGWSHNRSLDGYFVVEK